ncbi:DUF3048 domain-containing protein [Virgibacillus halodenitrificans]|uniref:Lipoprotein YerB n=1 Tax=Virgibacillus halodenitrificans TaxID=1482 RepID=A0AAC9J075_VIRHA|nr:DUF3048 domain-containing protein [Virgibacillus halodenitrificans]APC47174.1 lipoprotein YerB [Virgibacillus halodenitrificans]MCG1027993.1 DUF3048 domain-containing protein [Virgibacillus halodenitrificans]
MRKLLFSLLILMLILAGCSKEERKAENSESKENSVQEKSQIPDKQEKVYPLTGKEATDNINQRMIGVMVNNHTKARPQTGLSQADMVFEILAEGQITRFLALFQSELPEVVGPVRSAREYYFELAKGYGALYIYHGAAGFVNDMIKDRGIEHLDGAMYDNDGNLFKRESFRKAPHNSYLQVDAVYDVASEKGYKTTHEYEPLPFLSKKEVKELSGEPAKHAKITYSENPMEIVEYEYNGDGAYKRFNDGEQTVELNTEEAIQVENVLIVETDHKIIDKAGRRSVDMTSGGDAYLLQNGQVQKLQWENRDGRIIPVKDGNAVGFVPGKTWINVIPSSPGLQQMVTIMN